MDGTVKVLLQDGSVDLPKSRFRFGVIQAQKYTLGVKEIIDGRAFTQELRIGRNSKMGAGIWGGDTKQVF
jgi:hypothetical protein